MINVKSKGTAFERSLVNDAKRRGLHAERAYASNGEALGEVKEVDLTVDDIRIQAKRRKTLPAYLQVPDNVDAVVFRQDRDDTLVLIRWKDFLDMLKAMY